ncbi:MAG: bifunctional hydroxymethylpyrimidine kinase/phosphomethylpyrimidine kinase [Acidimicrobiales bacterium]
MVVNRPAQDRSGRRPVALTIAGTDSGGGAGVVADLKTFEAHGVWGSCAVVAVTAQNTIGVHDVGLLPPSLVRAQMAAVAGDIGFDAAKCGMLGSAQLVECVAEALAEVGPVPLVVDPVLISKHGDRLLSEDAVVVMRARLLPLAAVVTPNLPEAEALTGIEVDDRGAMVEAARRIAAMGPRVVFVKGGHLAGPDSPDLVWADGEGTWLESPRIPGRHTHGTGCVVSAAICAELALGMDPVDACVAAKHFISHAIAAGVDLGSGIGPVDPGWQRISRS